MNITDCLLLSLVFSIWRQQVHSDEGVYDFFFFSYHLARNVCSQTQLTATDDYQTLTSPGYPTPGFPDNTKCNWRIQVSFLHL